MSHSNLQSSVAYQNEYVCLTDGSVGLEIMAFLGLAWFDWALVWTMI